MWTPVNDPFAAVNKPFFIKADKYFFNCFGAAFIQGKSLPAPVAGGAEFFKLFDNPPAVLLLPRPGAFQKFFPAQISLGNAFFPHRLHDFGLSRDGSVVSPRDPKRGIALHPFIADEDIL